MCCKRCVQRRHSPCNRRSVPPGLAVVTMVGVRWGGVTGPLEICWSNGLNSLNSCWHCNKAWDDAVVNIRSFGTIHGEYKWSSKAVAKDTERAFVHFGYAHVQQVSVLSMSICRCRIIVICVCESFRDVLTVIKWVSPR